MCPLYSRGLGIRDLQDFNYAMVGKKAWILWREGIRDENYLKNGGSLWIWHMTRKYFPSGNFMNTRT